MKILNQHIKSLAPKDGAVYEGKPLWNQGALYYADPEYHQKVVCWADEARLFNCIVTNTGTETATVFFRIMSGKTAQNNRGAFSLAPGEERHFFPKKQIVLKKDEFLDLFSNKTTISMLANCCYLSGHEWFHLRTGSVSGQVEHIGPGKVRTAAFTAETETRMTALLRSSQLAAQAEGTADNGLLAAWLGGQAEYAGDNLLRSAAAGIQVEFTI